MRDLQCDIPRSIDNISSVITTLYVHQILFHFLQTDGRLPRNVGSHVSIILDHVSFHVVFLVRGEGTGIALVSPNLEMN